MPEFQSKSFALLEIYVVFGESCGFFGEEVGVEKKKKEKENRSIPCIPLSLTHLKIYLGLKENIFKLFKIYLYCEI